MPTLSGDKSHVGGHAHSQGSSKLWWGDPWFVVLFPGVQELKTEKGKV